MPASKAQRAYLHAEVFPPFAAHWHETIARTRLILLGAHYGWRMSPLTGHWLPIKASLSELTAPECARLIDWLPEWSAERGVPVTRPAKGLQEEA